MPRGLIGRQAAENERNAVNDGVFCRFYADFLRD
jgi:hypothetical protein